MTLNSGNRLNCGGLLTKGAKGAFRVVFTGQADNTRRKQGRQLVYYLIHGFRHGNMKEPRKASDGDSSSI
jgi:hypothetical protein